MKKLILLFLFGTTICNPAFGMNDDSEESTSLDIEEYFSEGSYESDDEEYLKKLERLQTKIQTELDTEEQRQIKIYMKTGLTADEFVYLCQKENISVDSIEQLLLKHFNGNADIYNSQGTSALSWATVHGNLEICKLLLKYGATIKPDFKYKLTPLMHAAGCKRETNLALCQLFLEHHASIHERDRGGFTPLMYAAGGNNKPNRIEMCQLLLDHGSELAPQEYDSTGKGNGRTALIEAVSYDQKELAKMFVNHQKNLEQTMYCLLWCLKKSEHHSANRLYKFSKHLLGPYLKKCTLKIILNAKYHKMTAYYWATRNQHSKNWNNAEWLKPIGCPICWQKIDDTLSPCCEQPICDTCWEKSKQEIDECPFCMRIDKMRKNIPLKKNVPAFECPICMEKDTSNRAQCCKQTICENCWEKSLARANGSCPFCRSNAQNSNN